MKHKARYHMQDQVRDRVQIIMQSNDRRRVLGPVLWPLMAVVLAALIVVNMMVVGPPV